MNTLQPEKGLRPLDQFDYHHLLEETQGLAIVLFSKPGCRSCRSWRQLLLEYQALHPAISLFEVDVEREPALLHEYEIFHLPSLFLYVNGHFHCQLQAEARLSRIEQAVQRALVTPAAESP